MKKVREVDYPAEIPVYLYWDFDESAPRDFEAFIKTVKTAQDAVTEPMGFIEKIVYGFSHTKLSAQLPLKTPNFASIMPSSCPTTNGKNEWVKS